MPLARARARPPSEVPSTNREEPGGLGRLSALLIFGDVVCTRCNSALRSPDFQCFKAGFAVSVCRRQGTIRGLRECFDGSFGSRPSRGPRSLRRTPSGFRVLVRVSVYKYEAIFRLSWPLKPQPVKLSNPEPESLNKWEVLKLPTQTGTQISKPRHGLGFRV